MSSQPPPPPPPPLPEPQPSTSSEESSGSSNFSAQCEEVPLTEIEAEIDFLLARNGLKDAEVTYYSHIKPIIQSGPKCGLVALAMVSQEYTHPLNIDNLLAEAIVWEFTKQGEMYSVDYMCTLAFEHFSDHRPEIIEDVESGKYDLIEALRGGALILIPYDADCNHSPCLKKGHKAHWAVLIGLISSKQGYYVLARHGKSFRIGCWCLDDLIRSNCNLEEQGPERKTGDYVIPEGGIGGPNGLKGRALILHPDPDPDPDSA